MDQSICMAASFLATAQQKLSQQMVTSAQRSAMMKPIPA
jgi:hypothetical protein